MGSPVARTDVGLWQRAEKVFAATLDCAPEERAALVQRACGEDEDLRRAVHALLAFDDDADFLEAPLLRPAASVEVEPAPLEPGDAVGPYRLLHLIGEGGMSRVYLAERDGADFTQTVAVKVIHEGVRGPATLRRFQRERRLLARLQHPNIARLIDGGATPDGAPYVVMEHVPGVPITRYCDLRRLPVRARLAIFRGVCDAVQHAHTNLVVHRDLKPSNILVTDEGVPKLLDFGIAAAVAPGLDAAGELTRTRERALTPEYASPEQLEGGTLTTATDVYSLGVVLHELLGGRRPSRPAGDTVEKDPKLFAFDEADAAARGATPRQLRRLLSGDLENIVRRALQCTPADRYPSVERLSRDIERHLAGLPVEAQAPSWRYRARKFIRRNAVACGLGALAVLSAATAAGVLVHEGGRVRRERDVARREQRRAEDVTRFLVDAFAQADPRHSRGTTVTAREVLDQGARRLPALDGAPAAQSALMDAIGRVYTSLGLYDAAQTLLEQALAIRTRVDGETSRETAATLTHLGVLHHQKGDDKSAEAAYRRALELRRAALGPSHLEVAEVLAHLGVALREHGDYAAAEPPLREALRLQRAQLGDDHVDVATTRTELAVLLHRKGALDESETVFREAVASFRRLGRVHAADAAAAYSTFAFLLDQKGKPAEAETLYREALAMRKEVFGERHPAVAETLGNMAWLLRGQGKYDDALRCARESVDINKAMLPPDSPDTASAQNTLGVILSDTGDMDAAERVLRESLASGRRRLGSDNPDIATGLHNVAGVLFYGGRGTAETEAMLRESVALYRKWLGPRNWRLAAALSLLADMRRAHGHPQEAVGLAREAIDILSTELPPGHVRTAAARGVLGDALLALGRRKEAGPLILESAAAVRAAQGGDEHQVRRAEARVARYRAATAR